MKIIMQGNWLPFAALIRIFTFSKWHHCGVIIEHLGQEYVVEARIFKGVVMTPLCEFKKRGSWEVYKTSIPNERRMKEWLISQLGKKYDWVAILQFLIQRDWHKDDKWYCSELVAEAARQGEHNLVWKNANGVLPSHIAVLPIKRLDRGYK